MITNSQIRSLRVEALFHGDWRQVDYCDLALAPFEHANDDGTPLLDPDGNTITRSEARAICERALVEAV